MRLLFMTDLRDCTTLAVVACIGTGEDASSNGPGRYIVQLKPGASHSAVLKRVNVVPDRVFAYQLKN